jgi:hypothetical protein
MIQRIQSLYLLIATVLTVVCMSSCIGYFFSEDGELVGKLYNLGCRYLTDNGRYVLSAQGGSWALFVILLIESTLSFLNIFVFKYRALQMRVCSFCMILLAGWYPVYAFFVWYLPDTFQTVASFRVTAWASLPLVSLILLYLAFRGILKDERLVRSLDRLR